MVAGDSPDWLPSGWKVEVKVKNSRKIKYYTNRETGKKFYSKNDIIRYVEMGQSCSSKPQQESEHNKMSSKNNIKPLAMEMNETPEWLPHGWIMELKTRKSGGKYKCYIDPLTGSKFYSRPKVSEYLRTVRSKSCKYQGKKMIVDSVSNPSMERGGETSLKPEESQDLKTLKGTTCTSNQKQKGFSRQSVKAVVIERVVPDGLPPGQAKEVKIEEMKNCIRKDWPSMVELTGGETSLKPEEVQDKKSLKGSTSKQKQKDFSKQSVKEVVIERVTLDGLPPGWIKEIKFEKKGNRTRKDPYYTDPVSGYVFRSQKDALRYLETGDINRCAIKPRKRDELRFLNEEASLPSAAKMNLGHHATRRGLFAGKRSMSDTHISSYDKPAEIGTSQTGTEDCVISSLETTDANGLQKRQRVSLFADAPITTTPTTEIRKTNECAETEENNDPTSSQRECMSLSADAVNTSNPPAKVLEGKHSLDNMIEECAKTKESNDTTRSPLPVTEGSERTQFERVCSENGTVSALARGMVQGEKLTKNDVGKSSNGKMQINSSKSKKSKATDLPRRSSKRISGLKPEIEINVALSERDLRAAARKSAVREPKPPLGDLDNLSHDASQPSSETKAAHNAFTNTEAPANVEQSNRGKNPLEDQAVPEDQPTAQETEKNEENMEPDLLYPFADSWSDPCLEFAFKTLTGAIPIEDNSEIPDCLFEQQFDSSHTQGDGCLGFPDFGLSNIFQNDISSDFDAPGKPTPAPDLLQTDVSSNFDDALGKPVSAPQLPENPALLPSGNAGLPTCGGNTPQQPSSGGK